MLTNFDLRFATFSKKKLLKYRLKIFLFRHQTCLPLDVPPLEAMLQVLFD